MNKPPVFSLRRLILDSLLLLAFFSLLTGFIEATYTFGLLGTDIPPEIVYVLFLLSPLLLVLFPRLLDSRVFALSTGSLGLLGWAVSLPLGTRWRMLATGLGCGLFLLFLAARVRQARRSTLEFGGSLGLSVLFSILLRALHSGNLLLADGFSLFLGILLAALTLVLLLFFNREDLVQPQAEAGKAGIGRAIGLSLGLFSSLILLYFCFGSPAVIARWGEASYLAVTAVELGALLVFFGLPGFRARLTPGLLFIWNLLFLAALALTLLLRQPAFSMTTVYPLDAPLPGVLASICLWIMIVLHPVIYADFALLARSLHSEPPSPRGLAAGFTISALYLLLMAFAQIFTTVYDYIPVVGPWFRNRFWLVVSIPGLLLALSVLLVKRHAVVDRQLSAFRPTWLAGAGILAVGAILIIGLTGAHPAPGAEKNSLRILTYNIQQGYGKTGEKSIDKQLNVIRTMQPDILGLEETDSARIAGGNSDLARYFADGLNMYSYYGPSPVSGTFGINLLSRYPIQNPRTFFMSSRGEQTAAIEAEIAVGGKLFHVFVTHLDNDGALVQQRAILDRAGIGLTRPATVVIMGDFNFDPSTEQYRVTTRVLEDAWLRAARKAVEPGASDPSGRIDHIFLSLDTRVLSSVYIPEGPSDHPAMFAEIGW